MLEVGVIREVINRVQKLRKSAELNVDEKMTMYCTVNPKEHRLAKIITKFSTIFRHNPDNRHLPPKSSLIKEPSVNW